VNPEDVRREVGAWLAANWDPDRPLADWRRRLLHSGWAAPTWPQGWFGKGLPAWADGVVAAELAAAGAVGAAVGSGMTLAAPTLLAHGSDELKRRLLPPTVTGEQTWCQLFSEPTNGSDLAGLITRAVLDGDEWVVNGQKLWSTSAHHADHGMLLARTDPAAPKHRGITYFVLPMHQPGVEVRPLHQMNGHSSFNEVFLTDARVPAANVVGAPGDGWSAAMTTLGHERGFATMRRPQFDRVGGRTVREAAAEAEEYFATYAWYPQRAGRPDLVTDLARGRGPIERQAAAALHALARANDWTARRSAAARAAGRPPGAEGSLGKLAASGVARAAAQLHGQLAGASGSLSGPDSPLGGVVAEVLVSVPAQSIAGGTDEIQHNIIGERVLGLPREPPVTG
jgi:alkylation response protein AidB-like acyl-CoA dehydrogenase